jgi:hypothetical protein
MGTRHGSRGWRRGHTFAKKMKLTVKFWNFGNIIEIGHVFFM